MSVFAWRKHSISLRSGKLSQDSFRLPWWIKKTSPIQTSDFSYFSPLERNTHSPGEMASNWLAVLHNYGFSDTSTSCINCWNSSIKFPGTWYLDYLTPCGKEPTLGLALYFMNRLKELTMSIREMLYLSIYIRKSVHLQSNMNNKTDEDSDVFQRNTAN